MPETGREDSNRGCITMIAAEAEARTATQCRAHQRQPLWRCAVLKPVVACCSVGTEPGAGQSRACRRLRHVYVRSGVRTWLDEVDVPRHQVPIGAEAC
jgi:hypothetical protein